MDFLHMGGPSSGGWWCNGVMLTPFRCKVPMKNFFGKLHRKGPIITSLHPAGEKCVMMCLFRGYSSVTFSFMEDAPPVCIITPTPPPEGVDAVRTVWRDFLDASGCYLSEWSALDGHRRKKIVG